MTTFIAVSNIRTTLFKTKVLINFSLTGPASAAFKLRFTLDVIDNDALLAFLGDIISTDTSTTSSLWKFLQLMQTVSNVSKVWPFANEFLLLQSDDV